MPLTSLPALKSDKIRQRPHWPHSAYLADGADGVSINPYCFIAGPAVFWGFLVAQVTTGQTAQNGSSGAVYSAGRDADIFSLNRPNSLVRRITGRFNSSG